MAGVIFKVEYKPISRAYPSLIYIFDIAYIIGGGVKSLLKNLVLVRITMGRILLATIWYGTI